MSDVGDNEDEPYKVGYGKPPKSSQFKPGESGNPKGRKVRSTTVRGRLQDKLHKKRKMSDGTTSTAMDIIIARAVADFAASKPGKWIATLEFLSGFDPKQKFKPTANDEERLNRLIKQMTKPRKEDEDEDEDDKDED